MENFVVSARKYRPATFASVVGQSHITSTLKNAIERGQLAHAYLFCGPRGVGKTTCARIFAKSINCTSMHEGDEACNECESCRSFNEGRSLNIHELDAASNNSVDDIRSLIEQVRIVPQVGRYSVFIIDEVHMLSTQAFNAFLKTLEEPPAHAIFILATTEKHKILPTILSRCQIYDFNRIRVEDGVSYLKYIASQESVEADDESLNLIARKADGGMRDALSMFDKAVSFCGRTLNYKSVAQTLNVLDYDTYFKVVESLSKGDYTSALIAFDDVLASGFSAQTFVGGLNQHLRDLLVAKNEATLSLIEFTGTLMERYRRQAEECEVSMLFGGISVLTDVDGRLRQSLNQRLSVELGLMKIASLGQKKNSDNPLTIISDNYPLPDLVGGGANSQQPQVREPNQTAVASAQPIAPTQLNPNQKTISPSAPSVAAPTSIVEAQPTKSVSAKRGHASIIGGESLSSLLRGQSAQSGAAQGAGMAREEAVDSQAESKLRDGRDKILGYIRSARPRFKAPFEKMTFEGNMIKMEVQSSILENEIRAAEVEVLGAIKSLCGIEGRIEFALTVNEQHKSAKPYKTEDKFKFLVDKNPHLAELCRALELDVDA